MIIIFAILYFLVILKLTAMIHAVRWIILHGKEYRGRVSKAAVVTASERDRILDGCNAGFFPFGVKDYRLSRYLRKPGLGRVEKLAVGFFRKYCFQFPGPAFTGCALLVVTAKFPSAVTLVSGRVYSWVGACYGALLLVVIITFSIEAFFSYAILGSYGIAFHRLHVPRERWWSKARPDRLRSEPIVTEMTAYGGIIITGYTALSCTVYFVSVRMGGFAGVPSSHGTAFVQLDSLLDSLYWTVVVPTDFNGAGPVGAFSRFITLLGFIAAFLLTAFVLFLLGVTIAAINTSVDSGAGANNQVPELVSPSPPGGSRQPASAPLRKNDRRRRKRRHRR